MKNNVYFNWLQRDSTWFNWYLGTCKLCMNITAALSLCVYELNFVVQMLSTFDWMNSNCGVHAIERREKEQRKWILRYEKKIDANFSYILYRSISLWYIQTTIVRRQRRKKKKKWFTGSEVYFGSENQTVFVNSSKSIARTRHRNRSVCLNIFHAMIYNRIWNVVFFCHINLLCTRQNLTYTQIIMFTQSCRVTLLHCYWGVNHSNPIIFHCFIFVCHHFAIIFSLFSVCLLLFSNIIFVRISIYNGKKVMKQYWKTKE